MNNQIVQNHPSSDYHPPIVIPKDLTTPELHEALEKYMATERLKGLKLTKAKATLKILKEKFQLA